MQFFARGFFSQKNVRNFPEIDFWFTQMYDPPRRLRRFLRLLLTIFYINFNRDLANLQNVGLLIKFNYLIMKKFICVLTMFLLVIVSGAE